MFNIAGFLEKFKKIAQDKSQEAESVIAAIQEITSAKLTRAQFDVKDGVLRISAHPLIRQQIFLRSGKVLEALHKKGLTSITTIR